MGNICTSNDEDCMNCEGNNTLEVEKPEPKSKAGCLILKVKKVDFDPTKLEELLV
jgi:hypothetical protein